MPAIIGLHAHKTRWFVRRQDTALAAFTRLRALTLRETRDSPDVLRAVELPASLTDITLDGAQVCL